MIPLVSEFDSFLIADSHGQFTGTNLGVSLSLPRSEVRRGLGHSSAFFSVRFDGLKISAL